MPTYQTQNDLEVGAMGAVQWIYPWQILLPTANDVINTLFPIPSQMLLPNWTEPLITKWTGFVGWVKSWFEARVGQTVASVAAMVALIIEAAEYAASEMGFDLWDSEEGLPSMPAYSPVSGGG